MTGLRVVSYGGGVQSTALLVLAARRVIDFPVFIMSNVGDDSEDPRTLGYVRDVAAPYAAEHGIDLHLLHRTRRDGSTETILSRHMDPRPCHKCKATGVLADGTACARCEGTGTAESRRLGIPVRMSTGAPASRACTADFKIGVTRKWLKQHGATPETPATVALGISLDEIQRANTSNSAPHERLTYPLVGLGEETGLKMTRQDCIALIQDEGLPVPPKSSCYFCPFHTPATWTDLRRERPDLFAKSVELERHINARRDRLGQSRVWLTRFLAPLDEVIGTDPLLPGFDVDDTDGQCDSGRCFT